MKRLLGSGEHLVRVLGLLLGGLLVFMALKALLVPKGFGLYGHYRAGALDDNRSRPIVYAGRAVCVECHDDQAKAETAGKHARIGCESCHGPLSAHASDPDSIKPALPSAPSVCLGCHRANAGRPKGFPQIDPRDHATEGTCLDCHSPHNPGESP